MAPKGTENRSEKPTGKMVVQEVNSARFAHALKTRERVEDHQITKKKKAEAQDATNTHAPAEDSTPTRAVDDAQRILHEAQGDANRHNHATIRTGRKEV